MGKITGTDSNDELIGTKGSDYIISGFGNDTISAGKGADTIYLGKADEEATGTNGTKTINFHKGDGNDAIIFETEKIYKEDENGNDTNIIKGYKPINLPTRININTDSGAEISYAKAGEDLIIIAKYTVGTKTVTDSMKVTYYFEDEVEDDIVVNSKVRDEFANKLYINGTKLTANDLGPLSIGSGFSYGYNASVYNGSAYYHTVVASSKNDIIVLYGGNDTVTAGKKGFTYIESSNGNDKYYINNLSTLTQIEDKGGNDLLQINGAKQNDLHLFVDVNKDGILVDDHDEIAEGQMILSTLSGLNTLKTPAKLKGVVLSRYLQDGYSIEQVQIADKNGTESSVQTISNSDIDFIVNKLGDEVEEFINSINYDKNASDLLSSYISSDSANKTKLLDIYKKYSIGTSGDNTYKINKAGAVIASGTGHDTFTFSGKYGDSSVLASDYNGDRVVIKNYGFSKNNLEISKSDNNINLVGSEIVKGEKVEHNLELVNFAKTNGNTISLRDKTYEYELSYNNTNWTDTTINRIAVINKTGSNTLTYKNNILTNKGNHDIYMSYGNSNDTYKIENFDTTTDLTIFDKSGTDTILFTNSDFTADIRMFANFDSNGNLLDDSELYLIHRNGINKKNITKTGVKNGIEFNNGIETIKYGTGISQNVTVSAWLNELGQEAQSWLGEHTKYASTAEVFQKGSGADINSLLNTVYLNSYTDLATNVNP